MGGELRTLVEAERQVIDAACALSAVLNDPAAPLSGQWVRLMDLDYACVALGSARRAVSGEPSPRELAATLSVDVATAQRFLTPAATLPGGEIRG